MAVSRSGIWGWVQALFCLLLVLPVSVQGNQEAAKQWLVGQIQPDGSLDSLASKAITFQSTTEATINLLDADQGLVGALSGVTSYLDSVDADHSAENLSRSIRTAYALGLEFGEAQEELLKRQIVGSGFGAFPGYDPDPLSTAYALETLSLLGITQGPAAYALQYLINAQNDDGSWALAGDVGRVQTTALAMHALWQYRHVYDVESPLQAAGDFLLAQQGGATLGGILKALHWRCMHWCRGPLTGLPSSRHWMRCRTGRTRVGVSSRMYMLRLWPCVYCQQHPVPLQT